MILVNFKIYSQTFGAQAENLIKIIKEVQETSNIPIIPVVSPLDAYRLKQKFNIDVFIQNINEYKDGPHTGSISALQAQNIGISGSLLNHSECRQPSGTIRKIIKNIPSGFKLVVCLQTLNQSTTWAKNIKPDYIAFEPKELIGNKSKSVATEYSDTIKKIVKFYAPIPILVGAGIHQIQDVKTSLDSGAAGILVSSNIVTALDPKKQLMDLASAFK
jgi:triosephosphate isomerase (TIM)